MTDSDLLEEDELPSIVSYDITVIPNDFNVMTINSLIESNVISIPNFQRNYVWDKKRASKFIESLIIGLPIPQIFLYQKSRNSYSVIDGQQRLLTMYFFIHKKFPKIGKRSSLRKIFDENGKIPDAIFKDENLFDDFKLSFNKQENGLSHPLNNKTYEELTDEQSSSFNLMPIRCMSIRQNSPSDDSSIYEIFSRLNTGGINLSPQEIRSCLYASDYYRMLFKVNGNKVWRKIFGKVEEDAKFKDVEIILRSLALYADGVNYTGSMIRFLNKFSKNAQSFSKSTILEHKKMFLSVMKILEGISPDNFHSSNRMNISLFESVFVSIALKIKGSMGETIEVCEKNIANLKKDKEFLQLTQHSSSHNESIRKRMNIAFKYFDVNYKL